MVLLSLNRMLKMPRKVQSSTLTFRVISLLILLFPGLSEALEPITMTGLAVGTLSTVFFSAYSGLRCRWKECCDEPWLRKIGDGVQLRNALEAQVYGQHIAIDMITENVRYHIQNKSKKPLVLSFHGGTGVGKNYVSRIIAETMFKKGMNSKYVHLIISTLHFPVPSHVTEYRVQLQEWIRGNLTKCSRNLFIFDEVDKIPMGVLDGLSAFLNYYDTPIAGTDSRQAVFLFLSNSGSSKIDEIAYDAWVYGRSRQSLTIADFQKALQLGAYNEEDNTGLYHSDVIRRELIDIYIPFLPLEKQHVEECVRDFLRDGNFTVVDDLVTKIAGELDYFPPTDKLFSATGCKRIREHVIGHSKDLRKVSREEPLPTDEL